MDIEENIGEHVCNTIYETIDNMCLETLEDYVRVCSDGSYCSNSTIIFPSHIQHMQHIQYIPNNKPSSPSSNNNPQFQHR